MFETLYCTINFIAMKSRNFCIWADKVGKLYFGDLCKPQSLQCGLCHRLDAGLDHGVSLASSFMESRVG